MPEIALRPEAWSLIPEIIVLLHGLHFSVSCAAPDSRIGRAGGGGSLRRRQHRRSTGARRRQSTELSSCLARRDRLSSGHGSLFRRGVRKSRREFRRTEGPRSPHRRRTLPSTYVYRLRMGRHVQTGVAACFSVAEYESGRHQETRAHASRQRGRPDAAHAGPPCADRTGFSHLPRLAPPWMRWSRQRHRPAAVRFRGC